MTRARTHLLPVVLASAILGGCSSSPPHYHGLSSPPVAQVSGDAQMLVEVLPIAVPERLDREEMVLADEAGHLDVRDGDRWAAPLPDEIRQVLTDVLWRRLRAADIYRAPVGPAAGGPNEYRLALRMERFEAVPGRSAVVEGSWTARRLPQGRATTCRVSVNVPLADPTPRTAAAGLSVATGRLAGLVADSIGHLERDDAPACPAEGP